MHCGYRETVKLTHIEHLEACLELTRKLSLVCREAEVLRAQLQSEMTAARCREQLPVAAVPAKAKP